MLTIEKIIQLYPISVDAVGWNVEKTDKYYQLAKSHLSSLFCLFRDNDDIRSDVRVDNADIEIIKDGIAAYKKWLGKKTWDTRYGKLIEFDGFLDGIKWNEYGQAIGFD